MNSESRSTDTVAVGILVDGGLALVARRPAGAHLEGAWEFPGGKVEPGEACEEALRRELREEVGVSFDGAHELCRVEHRYADRTVVLTFFLCTGIQGEPRGREGQELRWVNAGELEDLPTPAANRSVIRRLEGLLARRSAAQSSGPRERELKFRFPGREAFLRTLDAPDLGQRLSVVTLENHYFDTPDGVLVRDRVMLRIRRADHFVLGLKIGRESRPGFFDSLELEEMIPPETARKILDSPGEIFHLDIAPVRALRERFGPLPLEALGCLRTERTTKDADGRRLEFDRVIFPDGAESFELEIETDEPEEVERWLRGVLDALGVEIEPQRRTKLEQFVSWKSKA